MSLAVLLCSILCYAARNKARIKLTYNLKALLPYAPAYPLGGLLVTGYFENKVYIEGLGLLAMLACAFLLLSLIAANTYLNDKDYVIKLITRWARLFPCKFLRWRYPRKNLPKLCSATP